MYYKNIFLKGPQAAIGYEDENLPTRVIIDISDLTKYGTGTTVLEVKRPCDREAYIAEQTEVDGTSPPRGGIMPDISKSKRACFMDYLEGGQHGEKDIHDYFG